MTSQTASECSGRGQQRQRGRGGRCRDAAESCPSPSLPPCLLLCRPLPSCPLDLTARREQEHEQGGHEVQYKGADGKGLLSHCSLTLPVSE